ncbi:MAG TPA: hypothetical protein VKG25_13040 [Bryobacteraceae bacterium]|nr:hypothetical protein [Bryobacteraceae bacterium]
MRPISALLVTVTVLSAQGIPPRASASDYLTQGKAGDVTIAAEFLGHSIPTSTNILASDEYVAVEIGLYGATDSSRLKISHEDFSLRINGKKNPVPADPYELVYKSLRDPDLEPTAAEQKEKTSSLSTGGKNASEANPPPPKFHIPMDVLRAMEQRVQKASLPELERPLPVAGLIFFVYRGKAQSIHSVELIYSGPAGKATLELQP